MEVTADPLFELEMDSVRDPSALTKETEISTGFGNAIRDTPRGPIGRIIDRRGAFNPNADTHQGQ